MAQLFSLQHAHMKPSTDSFQFRGFAEVWSRSFHANAAWFGAGCSITTDAIVVRALGREHTHRKIDLRELRWIWLPLPRFIVVSRTGGDHHYSSFQVLRWSRLRNAFRSCGYTFNEEECMVNHRLTMSSLQIILAVPIAVWAIISVVMILEGENRGERAKTGFEWMRRYSPAWHKKISIFIVLPLVVALLLCHHFGL